MADLIIRPHVFSSTGQTEIESPEGLTIAQLVDVYAPEQRELSDVWIEDRLVPRNRWHLVTPKTGRRVYIAVVPRGGKKKGKGILGLVAMIAIAIVAPYAGAAAAGAMGLTGATATLVGGAIAMGITMIGSLAMSALFRPPNVAAGVTGVKADDSPAYSLSGQSNAATPYGTVQRVYGRHKIYPRVAATPKIFVRGGVAWMHCLYDLGYGPLDTEDWRIGDTPLGAYAGARINVIPEFTAGMGLSIYTNDNYYEQVGMTLNKHEQRAFLSRADADGSTINLSLPSGLYQYNEKAEVLPDSADFFISIAPEGGGSNPIDGSQFVNAAIVNGWGEFHGGGTVRLTNSTGQRRGLQASVELRFPYRARWVVTIRHDVPGSAYGQPDDRRIQDCSWDGLQTISYRAPIAPKQPHTIVELEILATDQLSGNIQNLSCIATSVLTDWYGNKYATRNPAMVYFDILTGTANPRRVPVSRVDIAAMDAWWGECARAAQDGMAYSLCDTVIDNVSTVWDLLVNVASTGRAAPTMRDGKYSVLIDKQRTVPVQMFTPRNVTSFSVARPFPDLPHCLRCKFIDPDSNWQQRDMMVYADGYSAANASLFEEVTMFGVTRPGQAWRDGRYFLAQGQLRRETVTVGVDIENLIATRGDLVSFAHDVIESGGVPARVLEVIDAQRIRCDEVFMVAANATGYGIRFRNADYPGGSYVITAWPTETDGDTLYLPNGEGANIAKGDLIVFGAIQAITAYYLVKNVVPGTDESAAVELVEQAPGVYGADIGTIPPYKPSADGRPDGDTSLPPVQGLVETTTYSFASRTPVVTVVLSWQKPPQTSVLWYSVDRLADDGVTWVNVGTPTATQLPVIVQMDQRLIPPAGMPLRYRVVAITTSGRQTQPAEIAWTLMRDSTPPADVVNFQYIIESYSIRFEWDPVPNLDVDGYLLEYIEPPSGLQADGDSIQEGGLPVFLLATAYRWQMRETGTYRCGIRAHNVLDFYSANRAEVDVVIGPPEDPENLLATVVGPDMVLTWEARPGAFALDHFDIYRDGEFISSDYTTTHSEKLIALGQITFGVVAVDVAGNRSGLRTVGYVVLAPNATQPAATVLGNNVLLRWLEAATTLPIQFYEVRLGVTWEASIGKANVGNGRAITFFEQAAGTYTYWVRAIDTAGNAGPPLSVTVVLTQPADYVLRFDWDADFAFADLVHGYREAQKIWIPVKDETWEEHYQTNGWTTPQDQIDAGFPIYVEPTPVLGTFDQVFDYGAVQPPTTVSATLTAQVLFGNPQVVPMLSYKKLESDPWIDVPGVEQAYLTDFQFIKVHYDVSSPTGKDLLLITKLNVKLAVQRRTDEGSDNVYAADADGTFIPFNTQFVDVMSIVVTPLGDAPRLYAVDFEDVPYPPGFNVYLFDVDGNRVDGTIAWTARGV